ncbi:hypothetical protein GJ744_007459 [Endocarpon pusillum]|uniref:Uncharacterized protein n=1 Tax=Endocarpon pusillum TaxID=364733 RepID=A0A8H7ALW0_9EURO|nr:hypothetical protein GJ744_007459 [Endocarpon pusillum]
MKQTTTQSSSPLLSKWPTSNSTSTSASTSPLTPHDTSHKKRRFIPQDQNIPWVKSDFSKLDMPGVQGAATL